MHDQRVGTHSTSLFPYAGKVFEVCYDGLSATNSYDADGKHVTYRITSGPLEGRTGTVNFAWIDMGEGTFAISWQEEDLSTVVHLDNFEEGTSFAFYTSSTQELYRLQGRLQPV